MAGMFKTPKVETPAAPKPVRMPNQTDPEVLAAAQRTRAATMARSGRLSTILTDQNKQTVGSSGAKLGA
jgi:hypothetical protein